MIGVKISKPGVNVLEAISPNDFYLHSDYPLLKVHAFGTFNANTGDVTVNHNLGYKPYVLVFSQFSDFDFVNGVEEVTSEFYQHDWIINGASWEWWGQTKIYDNKIVIRVGNTGTVGIKNRLGFYYIFKDEI